MIFITYLGTFITCKARGTKDDYGSSSGAPRDCKFPFKYKSKIYNGCVQSLDGNGPWCATEVDSDGKYIKNKWARCNQYCKKDEGNFQKRSLCIHLFQ